MKPVPLCSYVGAPGIRFSRGPPGAAVGGLNGTHQYRPVLFFPDIFGMNSGGAPEPTDVLASSEWPAW